MSESESRPHMQRVCKYIPEKLYGFAQDEEGAETFFHLGAFQPGDLWESLPCCQDCSLRESCSWATSAPVPILGEPVLVQRDNSEATQGKAPRATRVSRLVAPVSVEGTVESFDNYRGFGFAKGADNILYHLHRSEILEGRLPMVGQRVLFYAGVRQQRPRACLVKICPRS